MRRKFIGIESANPYILNILPGFLAKNKMVNLNYYLSRSNGRNFTHTG